MYSVHNAVCMFCEGFCFAAATHLLIHRAEFEDQRYCCLQKAIAFRICCFIVVVFNAVTAGVMLKRVNKQQFQVKQLASLT